MREILFRGKRADNGEWVVGFYVKAEKLNCSGYEHFIIEEGADGATHEVIPETVGQYTGLKDKNGKLIFEGDIVEVDDEYGIEYNTEAGFDYNSWDATAYFHIGWDIEEAAWRIIASSYGDDICNSQFYYDVMPDGNGENFVEMIASSAKIVGNIHDNPELLEVQYD